MTDDSKAGKDRLSLRDLIGTLATWGGKGKDEIIQVLCREIGIATAAILKEPLNQVIENRRLQITLELIPKDKSEGKKPPQKKRTKRRAQTARP